VQLLSGELEEPVPVTMTVKTRHAPALLALVHAAGLLLGVLARVVLPAWARRSALLRDRRDLLLQLKARRRSSTDASLRQVIDQATVGLRGWQRVDTMRERVTAATRTVAAAIEDLEARLATVTAQVEVRRQAARPRDLLPAAVQVRLDEVAEALDTAQKALLERRDPPAVAAELARVDTQLLSMGDHARSYLSELSAHTGALATVLAGKVHGAAGVLRARVEVLTGIVSAGGVGTSGGGAAAPAGAEGATGAVPGTGSEGAGAGADPFREVGALLDACSRAAVFLPSIYEAARALAHEATTLDGLPDGVGAEGVRSRAAELTGALPSGPTLATLASRVKAVLDALHDALVDGLAPDAAALVDAELGTGDLSAAVRARQAALTSGTLLSRSGTGGPGLDGEAGAGVDEPPAVPTLPAIPVPWVDRLVAAPGRAFLGMLSVGAWLVHLLLAVAIVMLSGYALFLPDWLGDTNDLAQAFAWAFAVDTSLAGLAALVGSRQTTTVANP
jgi:hypothetical protein